MVKSKKQMFIIIGVFTLVMMLGTITYAFFNYTRTGTANTIKVGRISFVSKNEETISLTNLFPIDPSESGVMEDTTKVGTYSIEIKGDTDYVDGIEYLVSAVDANIYTNQGQIVPISLDVTVTDLGTASPNYFTARESKNATIYKKIVGDTLAGDQMLLVGYIKPNTTSGTAEGVDGSITIKAYLDKNKILISDTYDGTESDNMGTTNNQAEGKTVITTSEWNALQSAGVSFKVKVEANEGIWVIGSMEEIMKRDNIGIDTENGVDFSEVSRSDGLNNEGTKGVYLRAGTENDDYPIMYYRGAVEDNNVIFNNKCWEAVRTTDTGGVKLIYNGELKTVYIEEYASPDIYATENDGDIFTFDSTDSTWNYEVNDGKDHEIAFKVPAGENYDMVISGTTGSTCGLGLNIFKDGSLIGGNGGGGGSAISHTQTYGTLTSSNVLKVTITGASTTSSSCTVNLKINMQQGTTKLSKNDYSMLVLKDRGDVGCDNNGDDIYINMSGINTFAFNTNSNSPAYVGYMWGIAYESSTEDWTANAKFGSGFTWDGTKYKLVDADTTTPNDTHHYSCNQVNADATCTSIRYVYWLNGSTKYYITISDGKGIEEAIQDMQANVTDSTAKEKIDAWYLSNMTGVTNKLEDTIWCNDRSIAIYNGWSKTGKINGSNADYKNYSLLFSPHERSNSASETSTVKNQPSLDCVNKNDAFTVSNINGNKKLTYPVALITEDELALAGNLASRITGGLNHYYISDSYLEDGSSWSMSPYYFKDNSAYESNSIGNNVSSSYFGLRPVISIKPGQLITKGSGIVTDPYVIE